MTKYVLISKSFSGNMTFYYNDAGLLVEFQVNSWDIENEALGNFHNRLPSLSKDTALISFCQHYRYGLRKDQIDLSFDRMYDWYGAKRDGHIAERQWKGLKRSWYHILLNMRSYLAYCRRNEPAGYQKMMLKTYLGAQHWKDDWDKVADFKGK